MQQSPRADRRSDQDAVASSTSGAYEAGVRLLGLRAHSVSELARKLRRRGFDEDDVAAALTRLGEQRYLDDAEFARSLVNRRAGARGGAALAAELGAKGVARATVEEIMTARDPEVEIAGAERIARGLLRRTESGSLKSLLEIAGPRLLRRGYPPRVIREACRRAVS